MYAIRLDRGLSPAEVLATLPGTHWERERGLNEKHYIIPGGGGFGDALVRDPARVLADVLDEKVSHAAAHHLYGVVIEGKRVDETATRQLRERYVTMAKAS